MKRRGFYLAVVLFGALVAALYASRLDFAPIYLIHDEVNFSLQAAAVAATGRDLNGRLLPVYFSEPAFTPGRDPMMIYVTALALKFLPLSEAAVRLPTALVGVLIVVLVVLVAWRIFQDARLALAAGAILALSPGLFIHSRMALSVLYPLPFVVVWLFAIRRLDEGAAGSRWLIVAGASLGVAVYGYLASVVMMPLYLALTALYLWERGRVRQMAWVLAAFIVVLLPILAWSLAHPERYGDLLRGYFPGEVSSQASVADAANLIVRSQWRTRLGEWWMYFDPDYLFFSGDSSLTNSTRQAGLFPLAMAILLPIGLYRLVRSRGFERLLVIGLMTAPLAIVLTGVLHLHRYRGMFVLPFGVLVAVYGLAVLWSSPRLVWRLAGTALVLTIPFQFLGFYRDYMGPYRERSSSWYGGNLRGALQAVMQSPPASGAAYISRAIPYADVYWRFYAQTVAGARSMPSLLDPESAESQVFPPGSKAITRIDEPLAEVLDRTGWRREAVIAEPDGIPSFVVFLRP